MTTETATTAAAPGLPKRKTLGDCQTDATIIHGLVQALDLLDGHRRGHEARAAINGIGAIMCILTEMCDRLPSDLDALSGGPGHG